MAPRKRRAVIDDADLSESDRDSVDDHIARRHARLEALAKGSDSEDEPEVPADDANEREVLAIDFSSDSEDDVSLPRPSAAKIRDSSDEEAEDADDDDDDDESNWGGRRRKYYGGDTEEHEIMEDEERDEALAEEEAEALRLQRKALSELQASDYGVADDDDASDDDEDVDDDDATDDGAQSMPELDALSAELRKYYELLDIWRGRQQWGETARTRFHLYATYITNIAFYFALLADPDAADTDAREHPVVRRIVELRQLIVEHEKIEIVEPVSKISESINEPVEPMDIEAVEKQGEFVDEPSEPPLKKKKTKKKKKKKTDKVLVSKPIYTRENEIAASADDSIVQSLLVRSSKSKSASTETTASRKRRQLNQITGALDSDAKNAALRRTQSADADHVRDIAMEFKPPRVPDEQVDDDDKLEGMDDDSFVDHMLTKPASKSSKRKRKQVSEQKAHVYTFDDRVDVTARRRASTQVVLNRGLTRYRPKEKKTPRTKNKAAYDKALKIRKTVVREAVAVKPGVSYGGEASGINMSARRGARLSHF